MTVNRVSDFRDWLAAQHRWSPKAQNDLISRLKRADRIRTIESATSFDDYVKSLESSVEWGSVPQTSRNGMVAASRLYLEWRTRN